MAKYFALEYTGPFFDRSFNIGDDIQTIAASRLLPKVDGYVSREGLDTATESGVIPLNGYFMASDHWPPAPGLTPVFFSFHIASHAQTVICSQRGLAYLKEHEPIGCRDTGTADLLTRHGIEAYYSKCLTLTLERRREPVTDGSVYIVDVRKKCYPVIPRTLLKRAVKVSHGKNKIPALPTPIKLQIAGHVLETYKRTASLVITSRLHCALPCIAMGVPVVFLYPDREDNDYRVKIVNDLISINYVPGSLLGRSLLNRYHSGRIDWNPQPIDLEDEKRSITVRFLEALRLAERKHQSKSRT